MRKSKRKSPKPPQLSWRPSSPSSPPVPGPSQKPQPPPRPPGPIRPEGRTDPATDNRTQRSIGLQTEPFLAIPIARRMQFSLENESHASLINKVISDQCLVACRLKIPTESLPVPNLMTTPELLRFGILIRAMKLHLLKE